MPAKLTLAVCYFYDVIYMLTIKMKRYYAQKVPMGSCVVKFLAWCKNNPVKMFLLDLT